ncbi:MAG: hypothetical protein GY778_12710 [bacterium]|nr:hypothetical protein [bacterium]
MAEHRVVVCPNCMQKYRVPAERMGSRAVCKTCGEHFRISSPEPLDDDTVFGWITGDDPGGTSVMGSTAIFAPKGETRARWHRPPPPQTPRVQFDRIDEIGAYFEFPVEALNDAELRCSFPHRCIHCLSPRDLSAHLIIWGDKLPRADALRLNEAEIKASRKLNDLMKQDPAYWLERLEPVAVLPPPFSQPFPYFVCGQCSVIGEVVSHVLNHEGKEFGQIAIANLAIALDFYRNNGGRGQSGYQPLLVASRQQKDNQWKSLPFAVRAKISQWFTEQDGEKFLGFYADEDFSRSEAGSAGLVLTDQRMLFKKYASHREYPLAKGGRLFVEASRAAAMIELSQEGQRDAMLTLRPLAASSLARTLTDLKQPWEIQVNAVDV